MLRLFVWLIWFSILALGFLELSGVGIVSRLGDIARVSAVVTFSGTLLILLTVLIADSKIVVSFLIRGPMRRAFGEIQRNKGVTLSPAATELINALTKEIANVSNVQAKTAGSILSESLASFSSNLDDRWPHNLRGVSTWASKASNALQRSLLNRVLILESNKIAITKLSEVAELSTTYEAQIPVVYAELANSLFDNSSNYANFADFVTQFTGAVVLGDAVQTRPGVAMRARIWHQASFEPINRVGNNEEEQYKARYEDSHGIYSRNCVFENELRKSSKSRVGDYDGRVLNVNGVALTQDARTGEIELLLSTSETCYAATELSDQACKGPIQGAVSDIAMDAPWEEDPKFAIWGRAEYRGRRLSLLTVNVAIIMGYEINGETRAGLLYSRRSTQLRNGNGVRSIVGGVMNLPVDQTGGDVGTNGAPDPQVAARREVLEEIGVDINPEQLFPSSVSLFNQLDPPQDPKSKQRGQLVTSIGYIAHVNMSLEQIRQQRMHVSAGVGRYELEHLGEIPLPPIETDAVDLDAAKLTAAVQLAKETAYLCRSLDQVTMTALLYVAAGIYGTSATYRAFTEHWPLSWSENYWERSGNTDVSAKEATRVARDLASQRRPSR